MIQILQGDWIERLRELPEASAQMCVTSPPYWGLRDYGAKGQFGLEKTPEEYVAKLVEGFREVRHVLRDDGTLWINLGDSYASFRDGKATPDTTRGDDVGTLVPKGFAKNRMASTFAGTGIKHKDLVGIPWSVAKALQQPYYTGRIQRIEDRIWLAAMLEAEGCLFIHKRKIGQNAGNGYTRQNDTYSPGLEIANTHEAIVRRCIEIAGVGSICLQTPQQNTKRKQTIFRWNLRTVESRELVRELYPYIVAKRQQARIFCGCPTSGRDAEAAHAALKLLHNGRETTVDFPEPKSVFEPGWYLRSDVIWSKPNPMPESVTDRPTKAHEYIFLLSKGPKYFYDAAAIAEPISESMMKQIEEGYNGHSTKDFFGHKAQDASGTKSRIIEGYRKRIGKEGQNSRIHVSRDPAHEREYNGKHRNEHHQAAGRRLLKNVAEARANGGDHDNPFGLTRNKRTVWTVTTAPYQQAHFATFPPELITPCILAGSRPGDTVLDPFAGSGTTGQVALELGRKAVLIELNPKYVELIRQRTNVTPGLQLA